MSIALKTDRSFAAGSGLHRDPFLYTGKLLFGFDFHNTDPAVWKTGIVTGQTATAYDYNGGAPTVSDAQWAAHPSGIGVSLTAAGRLTYNFNLPSLNNNADGVRRTWISVIGAKYPLPTNALGIMHGGFYSSPPFCTQFFIINPALQVESASSSLVNGSSGTFTLGGRTGNSDVIILRALGDGTWDWEVVGVRNSRKTLTAGAGAILGTGSHSGAFSAATIAPIDLFQLGLYQDLTDAEQDDQIRLIMRRFAAVLGK